MNKNEQKWPTIAIPKEDQEIVKKIAAYPGVLHLFKSQEILMIAASLAVELDAPKVDDMSSFKNKVDITHGSLLSGADNSEYRQYISLIYFSTKADRNLNVMGDLKDAVANFVDYAHRGLQILDKNYCRSGGPEEFEKLVAKYLKKSVDE